MKKLCIKIKLYSAGISCNSFPHPHLISNENLPNYSSKWCKVDCIPVRFYIPVSESNSEVKVGQAVLVFVKRSFLWNAEIRP